MSLRAVDSAEGEVNQYEDLWQIEGRQAWYEAKFSANDMPDWNPATYLETKQITPEVKLVSVQCETSRLRIPLRSAYKHVAQKCRIRVNGSMEYSCTVASPPFDPNNQQNVMWKVKLDMFAGQSKKAEEPESVMDTIQLYVTEKDAPEVYKLQDGDFLEVGPFDGTGIDLRGAVAAIYAYPTVVIFASGRGIAHARALIKSPNSVTSLNLPNRDEGRLYYTAPNRQNMAFSDEYEAWENEYKCKVMNTTQNLQEAFDYDDTFAYEPESTCAVILTGGNEEEDKQIRQILKDAEITTFVSDLDQQEPPTYMKGDSLDMPSLPKKTVPDRKYD